MDDFSFSFMIVIISDLDHTADVQWVWYLFSDILSFYTLCFMFMINKISIFFLLEFILGGTIWRKPLSNVLWACLATWQTQRQWSQLALWKWSQKVKTVCSAQISEIMLFIIMIKMKFCFFICFVFKGDDMESLLFHFLDDWLYKFCADLFFIPRVSNSSSKE